jgi:cytolysin-activating lysine-acyltransferase
MVFATTKEEVSSEAAPSLRAKNGGGPPPPTAAAMKKVVRPRDAQQSRMGQTFAQIVAVLMRDPGYKNLRVADLEWLVLPPVMAGQYRLAHGTRQSEGGKEQQGGVFVPVAVVLWARVSPHIDKALSENLDKQVRLRPNDWASGDIVWLMAAAGHPRAVPEFVKQLAETDFKDMQVKMRVREPDGKAVVKTLGQTTA